IYRRARKKEPRISLSTVYRSLLKFKELGLVGEYHFDESHHHYEVKPAVNHHHLMCLQCGRVIEFNYDVLGEVTRKVPEAADFEITETELRVTGYCAECQERRR
ncbi:MAG: transcriptional repressor, partial [Dehalococcoidales bacterium]